MNSYIESNFLLELAALQEEHVHCESVLQLAESDKVHLVLPAFSVAEPYQTIRRRHGERAELQARLNKEIALLRRTESYQDRLRQAAEAGMILEESRREEQERLDTVMTRVTKVVELVPLDANVVERAQFVREEHDLSDTDALVLASVLIHLESTKPDRACFLQKDRKDFLDPEIKTRLLKLNCDLITGFENGVGYLGANT